MERVNYVDFIKGAAIIAVVFGHISFVVPTSPLLPIKSFFAYSWHIGVFFMVSGFFLKEVNSYNFRSFFERKFRQLYVKGLYFLLPTVLLHNTFLYFGWYESCNQPQGVFWNTTEYLKKSVTVFCFGAREPIMGAMWFIESLFLALIGYSCISLIINKVNKGGGKNNKQYLLLIFFILAVISGILSNKYGLNIKRCNRVFTAMFLIYTGKYMFQTIRLKFNNGLLAIASGIMLYEVSVMCGGVALNENKFPDIAVLLAGCLPALYLAGYIAIRIEGCAIERFVRYCGKESFYVMALHFTGFKLCTLFLSQFGVSHCRLSDLCPHVGNNILLMSVYLVFGVLFPLTFMCFFRFIKTLFCNNIKRFT